MFLLKTESIFFIYYDFIHHSTQVQAWNLFLNKLHYLQNTYMFLTSHNNNFVSLQVY